MARLCFILQTRIFASSQFLAPLQEFREQHTKSGEEVQTSSPGYYEDFAGTVAVQ